MSRPSSRIIVAGDFSFGDQPILDWISAGEITLLSREVRALRYELGVLGEEIRGSACGSGCGHGLRHLTDGRVVGNGGSDPGVQLGGLGGIGVHEGLSDEEDAGTISPIRAVTVPCSHPIRGRGPRVDVWIRLLRPAHLQPTQGGRRQDRRGQGRGDGHCINASLQVPTRPSCTTEFGGSCNMNDAGNNGMKYMETLCQATAATA